MNVEGTVINVLPVETGQGKNGVWVKNPYIIETGGQYPKKIAIAIWGETLPKLKEGEKVDCQIDIESREYNQRWYTEVRCFKVDIISGAAKSDKPKTDSKKPVATKSEEDFSSFEPADNQLPF
jgi:Ser-tRNA(Ala) deacylase AlaX